MRKIFKYSLQDMIKSRWIFGYGLFFLVLSAVLLFLSVDLASVVITLSNIVVGLTPLIGILFGVMYYYNSEEFIQLLLSQPIARRSIFAGMYFGLATSLTVSLLVGIGLPLSMYGIWQSTDLASFATLCLVATLLTLVFSQLGFIIALHLKNRIKGIGLALLIWLFLALIYDAIFLSLLLVFKDYPVEKLALSLSLLNPIDLARTLMILTLDLAAMMGYTGAVLQKFLGSVLGRVLIVFVLVLWIVLPHWILIRSSKKMDF